MNPINGNDLILLGFKPGPAFTQLIAEANRLTGGDRVKLASKDVVERLMSMTPVVAEPIVLRTNNIPFGDFLLQSINTLDPYENQNYVDVIQHMDALMRVPVIKHGAIMPDACPAGNAIGTIPVGGVVASEHIHPDMHSSDVCCSMAISIFKRQDDPSRVLDVAQTITHFGPKRIHRWDHRRNKDLMDLISKFAGNSFLSGLEGKAEEHFMTQGDGNHFLFLGNMESTGQMAIVTHHGSRGLGAQFYKRGKQYAQKMHRADRIPSHQVWINAQSAEGEAYWDGLQIVRKWTKMNHFAIHNHIAKQMGNHIEQQFWNEHNFVFQRSDGLFYHGKGATPSFKGFSPDDIGLTLIPMNMAEPILICEHGDVEEALGFAPHGAGRNMSRTQYLRDFEPTIPEGIDARFYSGVPDLSETPGAYKKAASVIGAINTHGLSKIVDRVIPYGSIMGGEFKWDRSPKKEVNSD